MDELIETRERGGARGVESRAAHDDELHAPLAQHVRLRRLLMHLLNNMSDRLSCVHAARIVGVERKYFSKFFLREAGFNFSWWNREMRIRRASQLLREKGRTIDSVALAVGYGDLTTFERAFKKSSGIAPRAYRRSCIVERAPANGVAARAID